MRIHSAIFGKILFLALSGFSIPAGAASAANGVAEVSCSSSGVLVRADGNHFTLLAPGRDEDFQAEVHVQAIGGWELVRPTTNPFLMKGGDVQGYTVKKEPEDEETGSISFHNYCIRSNRNSGEKDVVVPAGTPVIFTAYKNGEPQPSDWTCNGDIEATNQVSIAFNSPPTETRLWFIRSVLPVSSALQSASIQATDSTEPALRDFGSFQESGIIRISGPNNKSSAQEVPPEVWAESEVIYTHPCAQFSLTATLAPDLSDEEREQILDCISWSAEQGSLIPDSTNPLEALHTVPAATGTYTLSVSCGTSTRVILVKAAVPEIHRVSFSGNIPIFRDVAQSPYVAPDWLDLNLDGTSDLTDANANTNKAYHPIAYRSTKTLAATGVFRPDCTKVSDTNALIAAFDAEAAVQKLRIALDGESPVWSSPVAFHADGTAVTAAAPFRSAPEVGCEEEQKLLWEVGFGTESAADAALFWHQSASQHEFYLTYNAEEPSYESVFHISCSSAKGMCSERTIFDAIWVKVSGLNVCRKGDDIQFRYWNPVPETKQTLEEFLQTANGSCLAWSQFLIELTKIQFAAQTEIYTLFPKENSAVGFLVKNWLFTPSIHSGLNGKIDSFLMGDDILKDGRICAGPNGVLDSLLRDDDCIAEGSSGNSEYPYQIGLDAIDLSGVPAQGNSNPPGAFRNHFIVQFGEKLYDPSYGTGPFSQPIEHEKASIDGLLSSFGAKPYEFVSSLFYFPIP